MYRALRWSGRRLFRIPALSRAARRLATARGRGLALLYHRLAPLGPGEHFVVPTVSPDTFRRQIEVLFEIGRIVSLVELLRHEPNEGRPRFAITFDDDYVSHVRTALPILVERSLPATFFLSGRSLHGVGPFWFESLEALVTERGRAHVADLLGLPRTEMHALVTACEDSPELQRRVLSLTSGAPPSLERSDIAGLAQAGMTIGFHTLHHQVLPGLGDDDLRAALVTGRDDLAAAAGQRLDLFAYPHGRADRRTARTVRDTGYVAAWTGRPGAIHRQSDPFLLPRWEPGEIETEDFILGVSIKLNRAVAA
jgi:peptidoglycan/xylan/chitin deacetylase (PgdA/CDA1 family)